jgi:hypothetical protein
LVAEPYLRLVVEARVVDGDDNDRTADRVTMA